MAWWEASICCDNQQAHGISEKLQNLGALAVTFMDLSGEPILEPAPGSAPLWEQIKCTGLFEQNQSKSSLAQSLSSLGINIEINDLKDQDWLTLCQSQTQPQRFGAHFWVCPSWAQVPDAQAVVLKLDPGLAFGTGTHQSTALCLEYLAHLPEHALDHKTVIDFGCGSGILAIAAALLGAEHIIAVDHDPQALTSTESNAQNNNIAHKIHCYHSDNLPQPLAEVDLMLANILALPLVDLAPKLSAALKTGGTIVLAGLLATQIDLVLDAYIAHFDFDSPHFKDDWVCLIGTKK